MMKQVLMEDCLSGEFQGARQFRVNQRIADAAAYND
jgi:hypothetical protein